MTKVPVLLNITLRCIRMLQRQQVKWVTFSYMSWVCYFVNRFIITQKLPKEYSSVDEFYTSYITIK